MTRLALAGAVLACFAGAALAQEKTRISFTIPASITKYTAQHTLPVGDAPGHEVRIFDLVRTFGADAPKIGGVAIKEMRSVGYSDYTELNGPGHAYNVMTMANGDKIFSHAAIVSHNSSWNDPAKKGAENSASPAGEITSEPPQNEIDSSTPTRLQNTTNEVVNWAYVRIRVRHELAFAYDVTNRGP